MGCLVQSATKRNTKAPDKPNEDCFLCDSSNGIFMILDGVTRDRVVGKYPNPSPAVEVSKIFLKRAYDYILKNCSEENDYEKVIKNAFIEGNAIIDKFNHSGLENVEKFLPGTVGIIAIIKEDRLFYGYIGDCIGVLVNKQGKTEFTTCQTKLVHEHNKEFTANEIRNEICNNIKHPYSYGVLDGRKGAIDFVVTGKVNIGNYERLILLTDGLEEIIKQVPNEELIEASANELITNRVCDGSTDDKTVIVVRIKPDEGNYKDS